MRAPSAARRGSGRRKGPRDRREDGRRQGRKGRDGRGGAGGCGGFTLLEVLVALAVVAIALAAGLRAAAALSDNAQRLADVVRAGWCADNQLVQERLMRSFPGVGDSDFACEQLGRRYLGRLVTRPTPNPNFRRVDAVVSDEQGRPLVTLSTVLGRS